MCICVGPQISDPYGMGKTSTLVKNLSTPRGGIDAIINTY